MIPLELEEAWARLGNWAVDQLKFSSDDWDAEFAVCLEKASGDNLVAFEILLERISSDAAGIRAVLEMPLGALLTLVLLLEVKTQPGS